MRGRDKINIMTTNLLEVEHHVCQIFVLNLLSPALMGYGPVLTEDTTKVAIGKKDGTGPSTAYQTHLFAKMGMVAEDHRP
jgi:hypothetical protein